MTDAWLETLNVEDCTQRLRATNVGRIAVIHDGHPMVVPVNYKLVETTGTLWIALRTRPGNVIDQPGTPVALEIDDIDRVNHRGWSVVVRGTLHHAAGDFRERFDPEPWLDDERDTWLLIEISIISGRQLHSTEPIWTFHLGAYL
jgi:nitroimidazol reductase NimA-like FMN-containing flavoprotein (pyridoxamine 5'-phosphate oxidase superfamily)